MRVGRTVWHFTHLCHPSLRTQIESGNCLGLAPKRGYKSRAMSFPPYAWDRGIQIHHWVRKGDSWLKSVPAATDDWHSPSRECAVRARGVLQHAHTVITFILWEVCSNCSPVCKTRPTSRSISDATLESPWRCQMGTAIRRPFVNKLFPFGHGFISCKCMCVYIIYVCHHLYNFFHLLTLEIRHLTIAGD